LSDVIRHDEIVEHLTRAVEVSGVAVREVVAPDEHDVVLDHLRFHYLDWGSRDRAPVVFLHGGGLTSHTWDLVCLALRGEFRCLALDARGHGDSEWSKQMDYSTDAHARDVVSFCRRLNLHRPVVVGMSMGGATAFLVAQRFALRGLVVIDTGPVIYRPSAQQIIDFMRAPAELDSVEAFVTRAIEFNPRRNAQLLRGSLIHNLVQLPDGKWTWKYDRRHFGRLDAEHLASRRDEIWAGAALVRCPTLIVRGAESNVFPRETAEGFARSLRAGRFVEIPGAGHTVQGDNPRDLAVALRGFLRESTQA
jgi:esterase